MTRTLSLIILMLFFVKIARTQDNTKEIFFSKEELKFIKKKSKKQCDLVCKAWNQPSKKYYDKFFDLYKKEEENKKYENLGKAEKWIVGKGTSSSSESITNALDEAKANAIKNIVEELDGAKYLGVTDFIIEEISKNTPDSNSHSSRSSFSSKMQASFESKNLIRSQEVYSFYKTDANNKFEAHVAFIVNYHEILDALREEMKGFESDWATVNNKLNSSYEASKNTQNKFEKFRYLKECLNLIEERLVNWALMVNVVQSNKGKGIKISDKLYSNRKNAINIKQIGKDLISLTNKDDIKKNYHDLIFYILNINKKKISPEFGVSFNYPAYINYRDTVFADFSENLKIEFESNAKKYYKCNVIRNTKTESSDVRDNRYIISFYYTKSSDKIKFTTIIKDTWNKEISKETQDIIIPIKVIGKQNIFKGRKHLIYQAKFKELNNIYLKHQNAIIKPTDEIEALKSLIANNYHRIKHIKEIETIKANHKAEFNKLQNELLNSSDNTLKQIYDIYWKTASNGYKLQFNYITERNRTYRILNISYKDSIIASSAKIAMEELFPYYDLIKTAIKSGNKYVSTLVTVKQYCSFLNHTKNQYSIVNNIVYDKNKNKYTPLIMINTEFSQIKLMNNKYVVRENKNNGDVADYISYYGAKAFAEWTIKGSLRSDKSIENDDSDKWEWCNSEVDNQKKESINNDSRRELFPYTMQKNLGFRIEF